MIERDSTLVTRSWHLFTCASSCVVHYTPFQPEGKSNQPWASPRIFSFRFLRIGDTNTYNTKQTFSFDRNAITTGMLTIIAVLEVKKISFAGFCIHIFRIVCICKCSLDQLRYIWIWYDTLYMCHMCIDILCMYICSNITFKVKINWDLFIF